MSAATEAEADDEAPQHKRRQWRRAAAIATATTKACTAMGALRGQAEMMVTTASSTAVAAESASEGEKAKFENFISVHKCAKKVLDLLLGREADLQAAIKKVEDAKGTDDADSNFLDFFPDFCRLRCLEGLQADVRRFGDSADADDLTQKAAEHTEQRKTLKSALGAVRRSCSDLQRQTEAAAKRVKTAADANDKATGQESAAKSGGLGQQLKRKSPASDQHGFKRY